MGWNLRETWVIFYKAYRKIPLALFKKRNGSSYYILCCLSEGREGASLKNHQYFEEHIPVKIWFGENLICNDIKRFEQISSK